MTMTDAMMAAAVMWLLFAFCGVPGQRSRTPAISWEASAASGSASDAGAAALYSTSYQEAPQPRYVTPPRAEDDTIGMSPERSVTEVTIAPGERLVLANLSGAESIALCNRGEHPAEIVAASIVPVAEGAG